MANVGYSNVPSCGSAIPKQPDWDEQLIKRAENLRNNAAAVKHGATEKVGKLLGYEPPETSKEDKLESDNFNSRMLNILSEIEQIIKETMQQIERL
jgi:hypothetical protein